MLVKSDVCLNVFTLCILNGKNKTLGVGVFSICSNSTFILHYCSGLCGMGELFNSLKIQANCVTRLLIFLL